MSEVQDHTTAVAVDSAAAISSTAPPNKIPQKRGPSIHQIYALPAPIRTFPLPTFYPNNPLSIFHLGLAWLKQTIYPPASEPSVIHYGVWSETTNSVHITTEKSMRALWEQGFYGKGSLSRSEPNWLKRELVRQNGGDGYVSELMTAKRREERTQTKWERARLEQEAIRQTRLEEAERALARQRALAAKASPRSSSVVKAPVGPAELLALPNSHPTVFHSVAASENGLTARETASAASTSISPSLLEQLVGISNQIPEPTVTDTMDKNSIASSTAYTSEVSPPTSNGHARNGGDLDSPPSETSSGTDIGSKIIKRQKSVRFSPTVESTTFNFSDPPSPSVSARSSKPKPNGNATAPENNMIGNESSLNGDLPGLLNGTVINEVVNKEHLQLTPEESFFLAFGLGTLRITDPYSGVELNHKEMFRLFRQHCHIPARVGPDDPDLAPDDSFIVNYVVYHHFRSLGWVPRSGIKFAVDWLLYTRGPVFDHAEFGLIVIPSYSDVWWKHHGNPTQKRTWQWLHSVVRVLSHATKSLVLIYVDVPPPPKFEQALELGLTEALKLYKVREVLVKRWSSNRNR